MRIVRAGLRAFVLPLVAPLATAHGPIAERAGFLVTLEDEAGRLGTGEATPLPDFGGEDRAACRAALEQALRALVDGREQTLDAAFARLDAIGADRPVARAAVEAALCSLAAQREGRTLAGWIRRRAGLPGEPAAEVRAQALVSGATPQAVAESARRARAEGFDVFKLKLGTAPREQDVERVTALRAAIGPTGRIRLDANEAWTRSEAEQALARLAPFAIDFVEQPVARTDLDGLAALDRSGPIPVAADEALIGAGLEACLARRAARIFVVKPAAIGGIGPSIALAARARAAGIRIVFSNLIEGRLGRETATAIAAALATPDGDAPAEVHGLGTASLLARDLEPDAAAWETVEGDAGRAAASSSHTDVFDERDRFDLDAGWLARFADPGVGRGEGFARAACPALVHEDRTYDSTALVAAIGRAGETLAAAGLAAGDLVAVLAPPSPAGVVLIHALLERRIVFLPINARLREAEIAAALTTVRPTALLVGDEVDRETGARLAQAGGCPVFAFRARGGAADSARDATGSPPELDVVLARWSEPTRDSSASVAFVAPSTPPTPPTPPASVRPVAPTRDRAELARIGAALVLLTSGTSGRAKAAVLTRANLIASARAAARLLGSAAADRWLLCMPLFHIAGLSILVRAALSGARVVLEPRFDAARVARRLDEDGITHVSLVATTLEQLLDARGERPAPEALRLVLLGGGPASQALLARAEAAGYPIAPTYGLTEAASQVATRPPRSVAEPAATRTAPSPGPGPGTGTGRDADADADADGEVDLAGGLVPLPGTAIRVVDAADRPVAAGIEGEIQVRGPSVMHGYLGDPEATARVLRGGWLSTGDVGRLDAAGRLRVLDRRSDLIVSGGENVYPAELEGVIAAHPDVLEAGVVGVEDARFGARPLAFVVWRPGFAPDPDALAAWCRERLAGFKQPVGFVAVDALPRNASGKLLRRALAERAADAAAPLSPRRP